MTLCATWYSVHQLVLLTSIWNSLDEESFDDIIKCTVLIFRLRENGCDIIILLKWIKLSHQSQTKRKRVCIHIIHNLSKQNCIKLQNTPVNRSFKTSCFLCLNTRQKRANWVVFKFKFEIIVAAKRKSLPRLQLH